MVDALCWEMQQTPRQKQMFINSCGSPMNLLKDPFLHVSVQHDCFPLRFSHWEYSKKRHKGLLAEHHP